MASKARLKSDMLTINSTLLPTATITVSLAEVTGAAEKNIVIIKIQIVFTKCMQHILAGSTVMLLIPFPRILETLHMYVPNWSSMKLVKVSIPVLVSVLIVVSLPSMVHW